MGGVVLGSHVMDEGLAQLFDQRMRVTLLEIHAGLFVGSAVEKIMAEEYFQGRQQRLDPVTSDEAIAARRRPDGGIRPGRI
jgi:hypothetical protein